MKAKIKECNGELPKCLTYGKEYEVIEILNENLLSITDDDGFARIIRVPECAHLNGGDWEIIEE